MDFASLKWPPSSWQSFWKEKRNHSHKKKKASWQLLTIFLTGEARTRWKSDGNTAQSVCEMDKSKKKNAFASKLLDMELSYLFVLFYFCRWSIVEMWSRGDLQPNIWSECGSDAWTAHGNCDLAIRWHELGESWVKETRCALLISLHFSLSDSISFSLKFAAN